jgi:hypothetical protein
MSGMPSATGQAVYDIARLYLAGHGRSLSAVYGPAAVDLLLLVGAEDEVYALRGRISMPPNEHAVIEAEASSIWLDDVTVTAMGEDGQRVAGPGVRVALTAFQTAAACVACGRLRDARAVLAFAGGESLADRDGASNAHVAVLKLAASSIKPLMLVWGPEDIHDLLAAALMRCSAGLDPMAALLISSSREELLSALNVSTIETAELTPVTPRREPIIHVLDTLASTPPSAVYQVIAVANVVFISLLDAIRETIPSFDLTDTAGALEGAPRGLRVDILLAELLLQARSATRRRGSN